MIQFLDSVGANDLASYCTNYFFDKEHEDGFIQNIKGYMLENGASLYSAGLHFEYTKDIKWVERNQDKIEKASLYIIEWMKKELILSVGDVFDLIFKGVKPLDEALQDTLANIIMVTYLLAKRLGISFNEIDYKIKEKIKIGIEQNHSVENWYGDFSNLKKHMENRE